jgi:plasmid stability protein
MPKTGFTRPLSIVSAAVSPAERVRLVGLAARHDRSISAEVREVLRAHLDQALAKEESQGA